MPTGVSMMRNLRRLGYTGIVLGYLGLALVLPGCGGGADSGATTGPNPEVEIVPPTDASGKTYSINDESSNAKEK